MVIEKFALCRLPVSSHHLSGYETGKKVGLRGAFCYRIRILADLLYSIVSH